MRTAARKFNSHIGYCDEFLNDSSKVNARRAMAFEDSVHSENDLLKFIKMFIPANFAYNAPNHRTSRAYSFSFFPENLIMSRKSSINGKSPIAQQNVTIF